MGGGGDGSGGGGDGAGPTLRRKTSPHQPMLILMLRGVGWMPKLWGMNTICISKREQCVPVRYECDGYNRASTIAMTGNCRTAELPDCFPFLCTGTRSSHTRSPTLLTQGLNRSNNDSVGLGRGPVVGSVSRNPT